MILKLPNFLFFLYLSEHPEGPSYRISNEANSIQLTQFIRNKYEGKKFMRHGKAPPLVDRSDLVAACEKQIYGKSRSQTSKIKQSSSNPSPVKVQVPSTAQATNRPKGDQSKINPPQLQNGVQQNGTQQNSNQNSKNAQNLLDIDFGNFGGFGETAQKPASSNNNTVDDIFGIAQNSSNQAPLPTQNNSTQNQDANWFEADFSQLNLNQNSTETKNEVKNENLFSSNPVAPETQAQPQQPAPQPASNSIASIMSLYSAAPPPTQPVVSQIAQPSSNVDIFAQLSNQSQSQPVKPAAPNNLAINMANPFMAAPSPDMNPTTGNNLFSTQNTGALNQPQNNSNPFADFASFGNSSTTATSNNNSNPFDAFSDLSNNNNNKNNANAPNALDNLQLF